MDPAKLTPLQLDALTEVTHIGCGSAATALSQLLHGRPVALAVTRSEVMSTAGLEAHLQQIEGETLVGVQVLLRGGIEGAMLLAYPEVHGRNLARLLAGPDEAPPTGDLGTLGESALLEVGNIVSSAYLNAVGAVTGLLTMPSVPHPARGNAAALAALLRESVPDNERFLLLETWMEVGGEEPFNGHVMIVPSNGSLGKLLEALGM